MSCFLCFECFFFKETHINCSNATNENVHNFQEHTPQLEVRPTSETTDHFFAMSLSGQSVPIPYSH